MKKYLLASLSILLMSNSVYAKQPIKIDLGSIPLKAVQNLKHAQAGKIESELDVTNLVAFVSDWKNNDMRMKELLSLYSNVVPKAFSKYPSSKELQFSTYIKFKNKKSNKLEHKYISRIVITKEAAKKINWVSFVGSKETNFKLFKVIDFSKI